MDRRIIAVLQEGLPLVARPYAHIAERIGVSEEVLVERLRALLALGVISRMGVIVRHHELGYTANAMVVWDVADAHVDRIAARIIELPFVTLCYQRPRRLPDWPYNLFCMVHGRDRQAVLAQVEQLRAACGLAETPGEVLFSKRRFKQRGARYQAQLQGDHGLARP